MKTLKEIVEKEFKKLSAPKDWLITIENAKEKSYDIAQATRKDTLKEVLDKCRNFNGLTFVEWLSDVNNGVSEEILQKKYLGVKK